MRKETGHIFKDYAWNDIPWSSFIAIDSMPSSHKNWVSKADGSVHLYWRNNLPDFTPSSLTSTLESSSLLLLWSREVKVRTHLPRNLCAYRSTNKIKLKYYAQNLSKEWMVHSVMHSHLYISIHELNVSSRMQILTLTISL